MLLKVKKHIGLKVTQSADVHRIFVDVLKRLPRFEKDKERVWTIGLNRKNLIRYIDLVSIGALHGAIVEPREVYRTAIHLGASSIILVHNHPSGGEPTPSNNDKAITEKAKRAGSILGVELLDHIIVTPEGHYSFADNDWPLSPISSSQSSPLETCRRTED
jgi:DNA repair protein RadC